MLLRRKSICTLALACALVSFASGCRKKQPVAAAPPPPPPTVTETKPEPSAERVAIVSYSAEPRTIERGQSATLTWSTTGATSVTIEPSLGTVPANGSRTVSPFNTTSYVLRATGPGGPAATDTVTVTVNTPSAAPPLNTTPSLGFNERLSREVQDVFFDYDQSSIREDARAMMTRNADALKSIFQAFSAEVVSIEGHCDERGSAEYNLGLGDRRASATKEFLVQLGVPADKLRTVSYGKERQQCSDASEACYQSNRRAHFAGGQ